MATKSTFLKAPYSGYLAREVPAEDAELTRVGPGTPCGEYLLRFWQDLPVRIRVMGRPPDAVAEHIRRIPPAATPEADKELLREVGRRVADGYYLKTRPMRAPQ